MGYQDKLYEAGNIIGYTGSLEDNPTVYFQSGNKFGHITQAHNKADNVGREKVRESSTYKIENVVVEGKGTRCQEWIVSESGEKQVFHTSRSVFVPIDKDNAQQAGVMARSITGCQGVKSRYSGSG